MVVGESPVRPKLRLASDGSALVRIRFRRPWGSRKSRVSWEPLESFRQSADGSEVTRDSADTRREPARRTAVHRSERQAVRTGVVSRDGGSPDELRLSPLLRNSDARSCIESLPGSARTRSSPIGRPSPRAEGAGHGPPPLAPPFGRCRSARIPGTFLEPFPKRLHPLRTEAEGHRFQVCGAACRIEVRPVYSREAHPFRETP